MIFDSKFTFKQHLCSVSSSVALKIGLLRKLFKVLPCLEYYSPVWCSAADSHLRLLDRNLNAIRLLIPGLSVDLWHRCSISSLCMLFKICRNPEDPLYSCLPGQFRPVQITRCIFVLLTTLFFLL